MTTTRLDLDPFLPSHAATYDACVARLAGLLGGRRDPARRTRQGPQPFAGLFQRNFIPIVLGGALAVIARGDAGTDLALETADIAIRPLRYRTRSTVGGAP